ncbi:MAG: gfo/Idh/MocA family oxidoreductase, partial [Planctomycetia bacterium]
MRSAPFSRRRFLAAGSAAAIAPVVIPGSALGLDGVAAPSERIVVGGIGIGRRGGYDLGCFLEQPDVRFAAVCDVKEARRTAVKKMADDKHGDARCTMHRDYRELLDL